MRFVAVLALLGSTVVVACAATPAPESFQNEPAAGSRTSKRTSKSDDAPAPAPSAVPDRDAPPEAVPTSTEPETAPPVQATDTTWTGTLAATTATSFGGSPYCDYRTHLEDVNVKLVIGSDGKVKSADVTGKAVEEALNGCEYAPIAPNTHDYALTAGADSTSFTVNGGGSAAQPHALMTADVSADGATGSVALTWHRNDIDAPFDWTITATVPLTKQ
jgi:hypothetical protein